MIVCQGNKSSAVNCLAVNMLHNFLPTERSVLEKTVPEVMDTAVGLCLQKRDTVFPKNEGKCLAKKKNPEQPRVMIAASFLNDFL